MESSKFCTNIIPVMAVANIYTNIDFLQKKFILFIQALLEFPWKHDKAELVQER